MTAIQQYNTANSTADVKIAYDFFLHVWKKDPTVTQSLIQAAFSRAATKAHATAPPDVAPYIFSSQTSG
jgi:hypothetical protein